MANLFRSAVILFLLFCVTDSQSQLLSSNAEDNDRIFDGIGGLFNLGQNQSLKFGKLIIPPYYDRFEIPLKNNSEPLSVKVSLTIRSVLAIDQYNGKIKVDADFGMKWHDVRIFPDFKNKNATIAMDSTALKILWKPDISIEQLSTIDRAALISQPVELIVDSAGDFVYHTRTTMKLRCDMSFKFFPADSQSCFYHIRSFSYPKEEMELSWAEGGHAYLENPSHANWDVMIYNVEPKENLAVIYLEELGERSGNYTTLQFYIKTRRNLSYHLVQTYLPSFLLIMITWVCFLLPSEMVEVRIGISMTTMLTLTALFASARQESPEVSYTMAIDVWMVFTIFLVFITLLLFTTIYWMKRALTIKRKAVAENEELKEFDDELHRSLERYRRTVKFTKNYAFWIFAVMFSLFVTVYWICLIIDSRYLSFNPDPKFNRGVPAGQSIREIEGRYKTFTEKYVHQDDEDE